MLADRTGAGKSVDRLLSTAESDERLLLPIMISGRCFIAAVVFDVLVD